MKLLAKQIKKACKNNKYIALREPSGYEFGINSEIVNRNLTRKNIDDEKEVNYISWRPITLNEYINIKHPISG